MRLRVDSGSLQVREYWNGVGDKEQRHAAESAGLLCDQSEEYKTPPTGNKLEAVWRLEVARPGGRVSVYVHRCDCSVTMGLSLSAYQTSIVCYPGIKTRTPGSKVLGQDSPLLPCPMVNVQGIETPALCEQGTKSCWIWKEIAWRIPNCKALGLHVQRAE